MNKFIAKTTFILYFLWSIITLQTFVEIFTGESDFISLGYIFTFLLLLIEALSIAVILANITKLFTSRLNIIILLWLIYVVLVTILTSEDYFRDFREVIWWPLSYFLFYFIAYNDKNQQYVNIIIKYFPYLFIILTLQYAAIRTLSLGVELFDTPLLLSLNHVFFVVLLLPFAFLVKSRSLKYFYLIVGFLATLLSFKRSALFFVVPVIIMAVYYDFIKSNKMGAFKGLLIAIVLFFSFFLIFNFINDTTGGHITNRIEIMQSTGGAGSTDIYDVVWKVFKEKTWENKFLGSGHNSVRKESIIIVFDDSLSAHNDFLEVIYNFGIFGLLLYLIFIAQIIKRTFSLRFINKKYFHANLAVLIIFIVMSLVSHLILYPTYFAYLVIIWAITEGQLRQPRNNNISYERNT